MKKALLSIVLILILTINTYAYDITSVLLDTKKVIENTVTVPTVSTIGGEWSVLGLARSGCEGSEGYFDLYYNEVLKKLSENNGVLHSRKYTEYSRVVIALTAIGKNPRDVGGYNLLFPLADYDGTVKQGINGAIWALIAFDCGNYDIPNNPGAKTLATREMYLEKILSSQLSDGGWSLTSRDEDGSDPDVTGMALIALSRYQDNARANDAISKALICISNKQQPDGSFSGWGSTSSESHVQILTALSELGVSYNDGRFVKNGNTILDALMLYYVENLGFKHTLDTECNVMATEQCLYALSAVKRFNEGKNSLYRIKGNKMVITSNITLRSVEEIIKLRS